MFLRVSLIHMNNGGTIGILNFPMMTNLWVFITILFRLDFIEKRILQFTSPYFLHFCMKNKATVIRSMILTWSYLFICCNLNLNMSFWIHVFFYSCQSNTNFTNLCVFTTLARAILSCYCTFSNPVFWNGANQRDPKVGVQNMQLEHFTNTA